MSSESPTDSRPSKRPRTTESTTTAQDIATRTRDSEFWYEDGNIILVARDVEFRIYKGLLAAHSPVFSDMFSLPQPGPSASLENTHNPIQPPVVHMTDSPEDLRHILRACMPGPNSRFVLTTTTAKPDFHAISAYARLGHKYQIDHLLNQALDYLKDIYTDDFEKWIYRPKEVYNPLLLQDATTAISVVNIAHLTGCMSILPAALAVCCSLEERLLDGFTREDSTCDLLNVDDVRRCIKGMRELRFATSSAHFRPFVAYSKLGPNCTDVNACSRILSSVVNRAHESIGWFIAVFPFHKAVFGKSCTLCALCLEAVEKQILEERHKIWKRLPELLNIEVNGWGGGS